MVDGDQQVTPTEAAHVGLTGEHRGVSQKVSDTSAISLCSWHHTRGTEAIHRIGAETFFASRGSTRDAVIARFQELYAGRNE